MVALVPCKNEEDSSKHEGTRVDTTFSQYKSMEICPDTQGQLTQQTLSLIWQNVKPIQDFMVVLVICKNDEDPIKNKGTRVIIRLSIDFFRCSRAANSVVGDGIFTKFKLIQAFMVVLVTCKNEEDAFKNEGTRVVTQFLPL